MKGVIIDAFKDMIIEWFGKEAWGDVLEKAGFSRTKVFPLSQDVPDENFMKILDAICEKFDLELQEIANLFGEYWITIYAPRVYKVYYRGINNAKDFILKVNEIHRKVTENLEGACPPRFQYFWKDNNTLVIKYVSKRKLMPILIGLVNGVGKFFNVDIGIRQISENEVEVVFPELEVYR